MTARAFAERRKSCRIEQDHPAYIKIGKSAPIPCTVRNISSMGAFLALKEPQILARRFKIVIPEHWFEAQCEIRHVSTDGIGVLFTTNRREAVARFASPYGPLHRQDHSRSTACT